MDEKITLDTNIEIVLKDKPLLTKLLNDLKIRNEIITINDFITCSKEEIEVSEKNIFKNAQAYAIDNYFEEIHQLNEIINNLSQKTKQKKK